MRGATWASGVRGASSADRVGSKGLSVVVQGGHEGVVVCSRAEATREGWEEEDRELACEDMLS